MVRFLFYAQRRYPGFSAPAAPAACQRKETIRFSGRMKAQRAETPKTVQLSASRSRSTMVCLATER